MVITPKRVVSSEIYKPAIVVHTLLAFSAIDHQSTQESEKWQVSQTHNIIKC